MKIGILTQPLHENYGGLLQNYALQTILRRLGHKVETIDHVNVASLSQGPIHRELGLLKLRLFYYLGLRNSQPRYQPTPAELSKINRNTNRFIEEHIKKTRIYTPNELSKFLQECDYDVIIVGSDQCWRPCYNGKVMDEMFLSSLQGRKDIKRIAYAASFGTDQWEFDSESTAKYASLVKLFDLVTVREDSGVLLCEKHFGIQAKHVLDPTMLLTKEDYLHLLQPKHEPQSPGNLFHYILDPKPEKSAFIQKIADSLALTPFQILPKHQVENRTRKDIKHDIDNCIYPSVTSWLRAFYDAEMVVVDSFHGMVFSIIFNKPFWVIGNESRGLSRFTSLLRLFGLEDRLLSPDNLDECDLTKPINWDNVFEIWEKQIKQSGDTLTSQLLPSL